MAVRCKADHIDNKWLMGELESEARNIYYNLVKGGNFYKLGEDARQHYIQKAFKTVIGNRLEREVRELLTNPHTENLGGLIDKMSANLYRLEHRTRCIDDAGIVTRNRYRRFSHALLTKEMTLDEFNNLRKWKYRP